MIASAGVIQASRGAFREHLGAGPFPSGPCRAARGGSFVKEKRRKKQCAFRETPVRPCWDLDALGANARLPCGGPAGRGELGRGRHARGGYGTRWSRQDWIDSRGLMELDASTASFPIAWVLCYAWGHSKGGTKIRGWRGWRKLGGSRGGGERSRRRRDQTGDNIKRSHSCHNSRPRWRFADAAEDGDICSHPAPLVACSWMSPLLWSLSRPHKLELLDSAR